MHDAEHLGRGGGLGQPLLRPARPRCRLTVGEIDDAHAIALRGQERERAAAADLDVVGMGPDGDHVEWLGKVWIVHDQLRSIQVGFVAAIRKLGLIASKRMRSICSMPRAMFTIQ